MAPATHLAVVDELRHRGVLLALLARLLDPAVLSARPAEELDEGAHIAEQLGLSAVSAGLSALSLQPRDASALHTSAVRWFDHGRVPPYEYSNVPPSVGGHTAGLADVAGFYRAFGMQVTSERPDHLVAELEFLALVDLLEADARAEGSDEHAAACAEAARKFLGSHLGGWVDTWAARIAEAAPEEPWGAVGRAIALTVAFEARCHNVVPVRSSAVFFDPEDPPPDAAVGCEMGLVAGAGPAGDGAAVLT